MVEPATQPAASRQAAPRSKVVTFADGGGSTATDDLDDIRRRSLLSTTAAKSKLGARPRFKRHKPTLKKGQWRRRSQSEPDLRTVGVAGNGDEDGSMGAAEEAEAEAEASDQARIAAERSRSRTDDSASRGFTPATKRTIRVRAATNPVTMAQHSGGGGGGVDALKAELDALSHPRATMRSRASSDADGGHGGAGAGAPVLPPRQGGENLRGSRNSERVAYVSLKWPTNQKFDRLPDKSNAVAYTAVKEDSRPRARSVGTIRSAPAPEYAKPAADVGSIADRVAMLRSELDAHRIVPTGGCRPAMPLPSETPLSLAEALSTLHLPKECLKRLNDGGITTVGKLAGVTEPTLVEVYHLKVGHARKISRWTASPVGSAVVAAAVTDTAAATPTAGAAAEAEEFTPATTLDGIANCGIGAGIARAEGGRRSFAALRQRMRDARASASELDAETCTDEVAPPTASAITALEQLSALNEGLLGGAAATGTRVRAFRRHVDPTADAVAGAPDVPPPMEALRRISQSQIDGAAASGGMRSFTALKAGAADA